MSSEPFPKPSDEQTAAVEPVDVIVVGCGPVGLTLTHLLSRQGLSVLCLERALLPAQQPRAGHVDAEVLRVWQLAGVADLVGPALSPSPGVEMLAEDGQVLMRHQASSEVGPLGWASDFALHQPTLEQVLRDRLAALPRVELRVGTTVTGVTQDAGGVSVRLSTGEDGDPAMAPAESARGRYVIGCDGAGSTVRRAMGSTLLKLGPDDPYVVVDAVLHDPQTPLDPGGHLYAWPSRPHYLRVSSPWLRWELKVLPGEDAQALTSSAAVREFISRWVDPDVVTIERAVPYTFHSLLADRWREGRVLLAGDAAHQQPPFQGQGLCSGIRDVGNLGWKLGAVLRGDAGEDLLESYQTERAPHAREWIVEATQIGGWVQTTDPEVARDRDRQLLAGDRSRLRPIRPSLGPGLHGDRPAPAGTLAPQPLLSDARRLDDVAGGRFVAAVRPDLLAAVTPRTRALLGEATVLLLSDGVQYDVAGEPLQESAYAAARDALLSAVDSPAVLVRPDRYVLGVAADAAGLDDLAALLPSVAHPVGVLARPDIVTPTTFTRQWVAVPGFQTPGVEVATAGSGEPLVSLHGAGGLHLAGAHHLLARRFRVLAPQLPGFGTSPENTTSHSLDELAGTVLDVIDALGIGPFALLGTSFGGALALRVALRAPGRVRSLALEAPAVFRPADWRPPHDLMSALYLHPERRPAAPPPDPAVISRQLALVGRLLAARDDDLADGLAGLAVPTLLLRGVADGMFGEEGISRLSELLPDVRYERIEDAAHEANSDQPEVYADLVTVFADAAAAADARVIRA